MAREKKDFRAEVDSRKIPILTLDHKWHKLFVQKGMPSYIQHQADSLNKLLKQQGKVNTEVKKLKVVKKNLMDEIVPLTVEATQGNRAADKKVQENKRLIDECNEKIDKIQQEQEELPDQIISANYELMLSTMEYCYETMGENNAYIEEVTGWINNVRKELKKNIVKKQESELMNHAIYSYMHDIFGADVIEIFDMQYAPEKMKAPDTK